MDSVFNIYIDRHRNRHRCVKCWGGEGVVCVYMHRYMHFLALPAERGAIRNDISTLVGTSSAQILVSKHHPPIRTRAPFRNDSFPPRAALSTRLYRSRCLIASFPEIYSCFTLLNFP